MTNDMAIQRIDLSVNHWRVPDVKNAFSGRIVGRVSATERRKRIAAIEELREHWEPQSEAWQLVEELKSYVGRRMEVQFWDPIMLLLEDEGPNPVVGTCMDVVIRQDGDFLQAYIVLDDVVEVSTPNGTPSIELLLQGQEASIAAICWISIIPLGFQWPPK